MKIFLAAAVIFYFSGQLHADQSLCSQSFTETISKVQKYQPPSFELPGKGKVVFADFLSNSSKIVYNIDLQKAEFETLISLDLSEEGYIPFDLVAEPDAVELDGVKVKVELIKAPNAETSLRVIDSQAKKGRHLIKVKGPLTSLVKFSEGEVSSAFFFDDLSDRAFLEAYLPSNLEFDQLSFTLDIEILGGVQKNSIFTNGNLKKLSESHFQIKFPSYYTSSTPYFHMGPENQFDLLNGEYKSINGKTIPIQIYRKKNDPTADMNKALVDAQDSLRELENTYGAYIHKSLLVYLVEGANNVPSTFIAMEYAGATITPSRSQNHEIAHNWFARAVIPANGNAGWIDEALTKWRDHGYPSNTELSEKSDMAAKPTYTRQTDENAYGLGSNFIAYLNGTLSNFNGFLRFLFEHYQWKPLTTEMLQTILSQYYKQDFSELFETYLYTKAEKSTLNEPGSENLDFNSDFYEDAKKAQSKQKREEFLDSIL